jgi:hypothetical protein
MVSKEFSQLVNSVVNPDPGLFGQVGSGTIVPDLAFLTRKYA